MISLEYLLSGKPCLYELWGQWIVIQWEDKRWVRVRDATELDINTLPKY